MKKRGIALPNIIAAVLTILVVITAARVFTGLSSEPVKRLLGLGNISAFDDSIVQRYNDTKNMNQDAIQSTTALLYGINRLTQYDSGEVKEDKERSFGGVNVIPTDHNLRPLYLGTGKKKGEEGKHLAQAIVDCWTIFADEANENKYCFVIEPASDLSGQVVESDLVKGFAELLDDPSCGSDCKAKINDLQGSGYWNILRGIGVVATAGLLVDLNLENIDWDSGLVITKDSEDIIVCSDNTAINEVHITTRDSGTCAPKEPENTWGNQIFIEDFSLPQQIAKSSNPITYTIEEWLNAYGDPEYILFYEKFPEEEAQYWHASAFNVAFFTIIATEAAFLGFDLITMGMGKLLRPLKLGERFAKTVIGRGAHVVKEVVTGAVSAVGRTAWRGIKFVFRPFKWFLRKAFTKTTLKEGGETVIKKALGKQLSKQTLGQIDDDAYKLLKQKYLDALDEVFEEGSERFVKGGSGEITDEGLEEIGKRFRTKMRAVEDVAELGSFRRATGPQFYNTLDLMKTELGVAAKEASQRRITRAAVRVYRSAHRLENSLIMAVSGDLPDTQKKAAVKALLDGAEDGLKAVKPRHLSHLAANVDEVIEKGFILESQKEALEEAVMLAGTNTPGVASKLFPAAVGFQKFSKGALKLAPTAKARHLIALGVGIYASRLESMAAKSYPVGTNAIGLKTPFLHTVVYDDNLTNELIDVDGNRQKFMEKFGSDEVHRVLLPEVNRYYLSLTRDKHAYWWDQPPIRFHLVSPCFADVMMRVTRCECGAMADEETGLYETNEKYNILVDGKPTGQTTNVPNFDGTKKMLYRLDESGRPIKECIPAAIFQRDNLYKPKCIEINPVLHEDLPSGYDYNYCYHGEDVVWEVLKTTITALEIGLPFACLALGIPPLTLVAPLSIPSCMAAVGFAAGLAGETTKGIVETTHQWPNHS